MYLKQYHPCSFLPPGKVPFRLFENVARNMAVVARTTRAAHDRRSKGEVGGTAAAQVRHLRWRARRGLQGGRFAIPNAARAAPDPPAPRPPALALIILVVLP